MVSCLTTVFLPSTWAADLSAQLGAFTHDVTAPYVGNIPGVPPDSPLNKAREILRQERLLGGARPSTSNVDLAGAYRNPLMLGTSASRVAPELARLHGAALGGDAARVRSDLAQIYEKLGRKVPADAAMEKLVQAAMGAADTIKTENEEFAVQKTDYSVRTSYSSGTGHVATEVRAKDAAGEPFRASFRGQVTGKAAPDGKSVQLKAEPEAKPRVIDSKEAKRLAQSITGEWVDQENKIWKIAVDGSALTMMTTGRNDRPVVYKGTYDLGQLKAAHKIEHPDDITIDLPLPIRTQLATQYQPPFEVELEVEEDVSRLTGTWTSRHVSYSGMSMEITKIHDPYDQPLVLTRGGLLTALGMKEGDKP